MKRLLFALTLSAAIAIPALAQPTDSTSPSTNAPPDMPPPPPGGGGPGGHHDMKFLTDAEKAELKKAHEAALAADPSLATEEQAMHEKMKAAHEAGTPPTADDMAAGKALHDKMDAAMIKADPAVEPIIEKIKAHHHGPGGPPPAPPAQ